METIRSTMTGCKVVSSEDWVKARKAFLAKEKEFAWLRDELSRQRRELPWERVEKHYVFELSIRGGPKRLSAANTEPEAVRRANFETLRRHNDAIHGDSPC